eukprot:3848-Heterococcus_DN1.PRE.1
MHLLPVCTPLRAAAAQKDALCVHYLHVVLIAYTSNSTLPESRSICRLCNVYHVIRVTSSNTLYIARYQQAGAASTHEYADTLERNVTEEQTGVYNEEEKRYRSTVTRTVGE